MTAFTSLPLTVRLSTSRGSRNVTSEVRDLQLRWTDPGGYASCRVSLDRPLALQPDEISVYGNLTVHDARNGQVVWDGRQEDPGRSSRDGQVWDLAAVGGQAHTRDRTIPLIYVDRRLDAWIKSRNASGERATATVSVTDDAAMSAVPALVLSFPTGLALPTGAACTAVYWPLHEAGQNMAVFDYRWDAGISGASWRVHGLVAAPAGNVARDEAATTVGGGENALLVGTGVFDLGDKQPFLRFAWVGAPSSTTADDDYWVSFMDVVVRATTYLKDGTEKTSGYTSADKKILASTVVEDLLGRLLTDFDGANALVYPTTVEIEQLAYPDGVDAYKVLSDLLELESGYTWRAWERNDDDRYRFEFVPVPTSVRYEADVIDGYDSTGSADGLYNRVTVRWNDPQGRTRATTRTASVPALDAAGLIRQAQIDLGTELGSLAAAQVAGDLWLADRIAEPNSGRLRIARPIRDLESGRMVMPWEIRPGLIRVRGILPRPDAINVNARDGVTIFRIVACEYSISDGAATLELDSYPESVSRQLAQLKHATRYRRR